MKTFRISTKLVKPMKGYDSEWDEIVNSESIEQCAADHDENLHRYGVSGNATMEIVEIDPETLETIKS